MMGISQKYDGIYIYRYMVISINVGTPSHHPFLDGIFPYKSSIWGYPYFRKPPYGNMMGIYLEHGNYIWEIYEMCMKCDWTYLEDVWKISDNIDGTCWDILGNMMGISGKYDGNIWEI